MSYFSSYESNVKRNDNIYDKSTETENDYESILSKKCLEKNIYERLNKKYNKMPLKYNSIKIENIMFNDKTHLVSTFKEHLIMNDRAEFLKRFYMLYESLHRLPKFFEFYDLYSKIFPNYISIEEGKYFYKNIQQKQRVINTIEKIELENKKNRKIINKNDKNNSDDKVFSTNVIDSVLNSTNDEGMEILFNINKQNMKKDESLFINNIKNIIEEINRYQTKNEYNENRNPNLFQKRHINHIVKINNNKYIIKIKNINCENIDSNINNTKKEIKLSSKDKNSSHQNSKTKYKSNKENYNILNLNIKNNYTKINLYHKTHSKNKNIPKLILMDKLENNNSKSIQKLSNNKKSFSHNISASIKSKKEVSNSKKNKSLTRRKNSISSYKNNFCNKYPNGVTYLKNKRKKNEMINYKKELLRIDLSKSKLVSRNNVLNFSLSKISSNKYSNTNHNSFIFKSNKSNSKTNILNNTNIASGNNKIHSNINYNFNILDNYSRNKSLKETSKTKKSTTNKNSKEKIYTKNRIKYLKRNSSKIDNLFGNTNSLLSYNNSKIDLKINSRQSHLNSIFYLSNFTTKRESKKSNSKKKLIKKEILNKKNPPKDDKANMKNALQKKYSFKNSNTSKIIKKNNSVLKFGIEEKKTIKKAKIKNIKINNFSKLFNVFIRHSYKGNNQYSKPQTERNRIQIKI